MEDLGIFSSLENLERLHVKSKDTAVKSSRDSAHLKTLQVKKIKLEEKKKALEVQLEQRKKGIQQRMSVAGSFDEMDDKARDALLSLEQMKIVSILQAYRLPGSTLESVSENIMCLRLDTCYCGKYSQPVYAELLVNNESFSLKRHTLPKFIPEEQMRKRLECGLSDYCSFVHSYLRPYMARREAAFLTQDRFQEVINGEICSSPSFDFLQINLKPNHCGVQCIKLLYEDIFTAKPTLVQITLDDREGSDGVEDKKIESLKKDLEHLQLSEVFTLYFANASGDGDTT